MKPAINSCRTVGYFIKTRILLAVNNSSYHGHSHLHAYSNLRFGQTLIHPQHKPTRLGQIQPISSNVGIQKIGFINYSCNVLPVSNDSSRILRCLPHFYMPQYSRSLNRSASLWSRQTALFEDRSLTGEQGPSSAKRKLQIMGETCYFKRNVGRSSRQQDSDVNNNTINISSKKINLQDRTRSALKGRVFRLHSSILQHKSRLRDQIKAQRLKGVLAVGTLRKQLQVKKEDVRTIPNLLTTMRMASAPLLAYLVVNESFGVACSIFIIAGITDVLDGYIARNYKNQTTALGTALDPLADKLLISFLTVSLTSVGLIPVPVTALILGRDAGLILASFYIRYISLAPPRTLSRYFDVSHVTAKLYPSKISKLNTLLQLSFVASTLASPVFDYTGHPLLQALMYLTATTTFLSGADYMFTWRQRLQIIKNK